MIKVIIINMKFGLMKNKRKLYGFLFKYTFLK